MVRLTTYVAPTVKRDKQHHEPTEKIVINDMVQTLTWKTPVK